MKIYKYLYLVVSLLFLTNCLTNKNTYKNGQKTTIKLEQNGKTIKPDKNNQISLKREPFYIIVNYCSKKIFYMFHKGNIKNIYILFVKHIKYFF